MRAPRLSVALVLLGVVTCASACGKKKEDPVPPPPQASEPTTTPMPSSPTPTAATSVSNPAVPAGSLPPDGKYERVTVDGTTVPMVQVMNGGKIVLVDTDGVKPRSWEEQYKRKRELPPGQFDLHKTNTNKNDTFEDDAIDKEGLWVIDAKGNITKR